MNDNNEALRLFDEFNDYRDNLVDHLLSNATFKEKRDGEYIRPLVVITDEQECLEYCQKINKWTRYVKDLCELDPIRFNEKIVRFKSPTILENISSVSIYINDATSTSKLTKERLIKNLDRAINNIKDSESPELIELARIYRNERNAINRDDEEIYIRRNTGHSEVVLHCMPAPSMSFPLVDRKIRKHRVSLSGMVIYDPEGVMTVKLPREETLKRKATVADFIKPIRYSLPIAGKLYRSTDTERAKTELADEHRAKQRIRSNKKTNKRKIHRERVVRNRAKRWENYYKEKAAREAQQPPNS